MVAAASVVVAAPGGVRGAWSVCCTPQAAQREKAAAATSSPPSNNMGSLDESGDARQRLDAAATSLDGAFPRPLPPSPFPPSAAAGEKHACAMEREANCRGVLQFWTTEHR